MDAGIHTKCKLKNRYCLSIYYLYQTINLYIELIAASFGNILHTHTCIIHIHTYMKLTIFTGKRFTTC